MTEANGATLLDEKLAALVAPLHDHLQQIEVDLAEKQTAVIALREQRSKIKNVLRALDPTFEPDHGHKPGKPKGRGRYLGRDPDVARRLLEQHRDEFANGDGFTGTDLSRRPDWPLTQSRTSAALKELHARGVVRLDRTGQGGRKIYVLV